ncbi:hypothetical protein J4H92_04275 [Leucobacter weissii]|uniref:Uncharacterized protein n=1 Tax=Leucobacter weissii TaxID=1983706 RepID=A0A939S5B7_9MICO|nr:hypothetical protein [Leucobacter weissii]MBO1901164.1 hypothetical protein [Leucobacter weissii]
MGTGATITALRRRIAEMQPTRLDERALPTERGLAPLLPGGALRRGASYSVRGSHTLALALLAEASASGLWCALIGYPDFGAEAAAGLGLALDRCVLVPQPGDHGVGLAGLLSEAFTIVALQHSGRVSPGEGERVSARLREHGSALVVTGEWPRAESTLHVTASSWSGLGQGTGILEARQLTVRSQDRRGTGHHTVRLVGGALREPARTIALPARDADGRRGGARPGARETVAR